jgi:hypothetical protein
MKFTIAAGILTQVLPAISEKSPSRLLANRVTNDHHDDHLALSRALKSILPRGGSETIGYQSSQPLDGVLKNVPFTNMIKACDPSSNDPDIGILSCNPGYECVFDQASTLGGFCTSISRDLQEPDPCYLCGDGSVMGSGNFGLPVVIPNSGYEGLTCGAFAYTAYANVTLDSTLCGPAGGFAQYAGCCVPSYDCDLCGGEGELLEDAIYDSGTIALKCGHVAESLNDAECAAYSSDIAISCCGSTTPGSVVPTPAPVVDAAPSAAPDTPVPPTSASEGRWSSTSALVSMMSLTVVTAASSLLLN